MNQFKFVYFDIGGVEILDYSGTNKWNEMKRDLEVISKPVFIASAGFFTWLMPCSE